MLLPIHAAVIFQSPNYVIDALIEKYLGSVSRRDDQGMLPLHLAFRHKQGDEDLMHLLLSHYPKAINQRDNRGRTPLELGRDDAHSSNLVQLYANASVTLASQAQVGDNARSIFAAAKEYEANLAVIKEDYVLQIKRLTDVYDNRMKVIDDKHKGDILRLREEARVERRKLVEVHHEEMKSLHEVVASTRDHDNADQRNEMNQKLEALQADVKRYEQRVIQLETQLENKNAIIKDASQQMAAIAEDQAKLLSVVERQQVELDAAHSIRLQLMKTLLQQEEEDVPSHANHVNVIQKLLQTAKVRIENVVSNLANDGEGEIHDIADEEEAEETAELHELEDYEEYAQVEPNQEDDISAMTDHSNFLT
jgi:hypothetical protein